MAKITDFKTQQRNANKHTLHGLRLLEKSVQSDGWLDAQTAAADGEMISGSARLEVAADKFADVEPIIIHTTGDRPVIVVRDDIPNADDPRAKRLSVAANSIAHTDWNPDGELLKEWANEDKDIRALFAESEWEEITGEEKPIQDAEPQTEEYHNLKTDELLRLQKKYEIKIGSIFRCGAHIVACGDSGDLQFTNRLFSYFGENPNQLIYDPDWDKAIDIISIGWDNIIAYTDGNRAKDVFNRFGAPTWMFTWDGYTSWYTPNRPLKRAKYAFWYGDIETYKFNGAHYGDAGDARDVKNTRGEYLFVPDPRGKHLSDVFSTSLPKLHSEGIHPYEKPVDWVRLLIGNCFSGDTVYDPFSGSGNTLVACASLGKHCVSVDVQPLYIAYIIEKLKTSGLDIEKLE